MHQTLICMESKLVYVLSFDTFLQYSGHDMDLTQTRCHECLHAVTLCLDQLLLNTCHAEEWTFVDPPQHALKRESRSGDCRNPQASRP